MRQRYPNKYNEDESIFTHKRISRPSDLSKSGWLIALFTLCITLLIFWNIVYPLAMGHVTPVEMMLQTSYVVEDAVRDLSGTCARLISSRMRSNITNSAHSVNALYYSPAFNISHFLQRKDIFVLKSFLNNEFLSGISLAPYHLRISKPEDTYYSPWQGNNTGPIHSLFEKDDAGLDVLPPCLAGDVTHRLTSSNIIRKMYVKITDILARPNDGVLRHPGFVSGPFMTSQASMLPTFNQQCTSQLLVQVAGESGVYFRAAKHDAGQSGVSISPWLSVHLQPGDAVSWYPGILFYIEPLSHWSVSLIINHVANHHDDSGANRKPIILTDGSMGEQDFVTGFLQTIQNCKGDVV